MPVLPGDAGFGAMCGGAELPVPYQELLATCHGLAQLGHELVGDPLDQRLFEATGAPGLAGIGVFRLWPAQMGAGMQGAAALVLSVAYLKVGPAAANGRSILLPEMLQAEATLSSQPAQAGACWTMATARQWRW